MCFVGNCCQLVIVLGQAVYFFSPLPLSKSRLAVKYTKEPWLYPPLSLTKERLFVGRAQAPHRLVSRWCPFSIHSSNGLGCMV